MYRKYFTLILCLLLGGTALAQENESIITDRPTQSAAAFVVPQGSVLLETGFINEKFTEGITNFTYFNAHIRYGLLDGVELRLTQNYVGRKVLGETTTGLSPLILGTKVHLAKEDGIVPQLSVIGQVLLKSGSDDFKPESSIFEMRLNFQNTLSETFTLGYNIGYADNGFNDLLYSAVVGISIADGWTVFLEPYGFFGDEMDQRFNAGFIYLAKPNLQFDFSFGTGLSENSPESFIGFGASFGLN